MAHRKYDLTGQIFGRLTVLGPAPKSKWHCVCECGNKVDILTNHLISSTTTSCGCYARELSAKRHTVHGLNRTRLGRIWKLMNARCYNPHMENYPEYGGRGITVCDEWRGNHGMENFAKWAFENGYDDELSIDRIDNDKGYEPSNCRWADGITQANNKRNNVLATVDGITHTITEWSRITGVSRQTIAYRLRKGWDDEKAVKEKPKSS